MDKQPRTPTRTTSIIGWAVVLGAALVGLAVFGVLMSAIFK